MVSFTLRIILPPEKKKARVNLGSLPFDAKSRHSSPQTQRKAVMTTTAISIAVEVGTPALHSEVDGFKSRPGTPVSWISSLPPSKHRDSSNN